MPIKIQYGNDISLLQAAQGVGNSRAWERQKQIDASTIANVRQYYGQQDQREIETNRLSLDRAKMMQRERMAGTPTSGSQGRGGGSDLRQLASQIGMTPNDQARLVLANEMGDKDTVNQMLKPQVEGDTPLASSKNAYLQNYAAANHLSDEDMATLTPLVGSESVNFLQFRSAIDKTLKLSKERSGAISPGYANVLNIRQVDSEINRLEKELSGTDLSLTEQQESSSEYSTRTSQELEGTDYSWLPFTHTYGNQGAYDTQVGINQEGTLQRRALEQKRQRLEELRAKRQEIMSGGQAQDAGAGDLSGASNEDLFRDLLGG